ncbi:hypothetical protein RCL1_001963 [Eukaryota sp. TZLM3-RCL]
MQFCDINVGGKLFTTSSMTLLKVPNSFFTSLDLSRDIIFVDRDPTHFSVILNYLRDDFVDLPSNLYDLEEMKAEAEFYKLPNLVTAIDSAIDTLKSFPSDRMMYRVFSVKRGCTSEVERLCNQYSEAGFRYETVFQCKNGDSFLVLVSPFKGSINVN